MVPLSHPARAELDDASPFLRCLASDPIQLELGRIDPIEMWGLVATAALGRLQGPGPLRVELDRHARSVQFAHAVGLREVIEGRQPAQAAEPGRTVPLERIVRTASTERSADQISRLLAPEPDAEDTRRTLYYVLNELFRNVVQHSQDPLGGVVGAQVNRGGRNVARPLVQVAVVDCGVGIPTSLQSRHTQLTDARAALDKALWPHISSAFDEGETGSAQNAGMGLFFISEMTKLVGGRLLIASRGASLLLEADQNFDNPHGSRQFLDRGVEFPGTLVAFEMPAFEQNAYDSMIEVIRERARERTPRRAVHKWLCFDAPPTSVRRFLVRHAQVEDAEAAMGFAKSKLEPSLFRREPVALDFAGISACTQSYVHALLYEPLRMAWALKVPVYVMNAQPGVRSTLELLEHYALGG
jgi:hypothetical protein